MERIVRNVRIVELAVPAVVLLFQRLSQIWINVFQQFSGVIWRLNIYKIK